MLVMENGAQILQKRKTKYSEAKTYFIIGTSIEFLPGFSAVHEVFTVAGIPQLQFGGSPMATSKKFRDLKCFEGRKILVLYILVKI